jgi:putative glutamine amidotransferase
VIDLAEQTRRRYVLFATAVESSFKHPMSIIVGIPACAKLWDQRPVYTTNPRVSDVLLNGVGALPISIPPVGEAQIGLLDRIDGLLIPGSPSNVHPSHYGCGESLTPDRHDPARDSTTLPLIRAAVARGLPVLAICRGLQELNVALGGSLLQNVHEIEGRSDHRGNGNGSIEVAYGPKHLVTVTGALARIVGASEIMVNSLHGQAVDQPGPGLAINAVAEDGTIEAISAPNAPGFVLGVQWHPEWRYAENPASMAIFRAFGDACRAHQQGLKKAA